MIRLRPSGADEVLIKRVRDWYEPGPGVFIAPQALFNPALLFTTGVNGTWYDPSDLNTLFQDAAGTTPVTAVEQPVGLMLDKSKGLVLGTNLYVSAISAGATALNANGTVSTSGLQATATCTTAGTYGITFTNVAPVAVGKSYQLKVTIVSQSAPGRVYLDFGGVSGLFIDPPSSGVTRIAVNAASTSIPLRAYMLSGAIGNVFTVSFEYVSELPGNHAFNPSGNSANSPVLSARYNLLTKTEDFSDAAWVKSALTATSSSVTATAAFASAYQTVAVSPSAQYTQVAEVQFGSGATQIFSLLSESGTLYTASFNLQSGTVLSQSNCTATITALGGGYYRISATFTNAAGVTSLTPKYWIGIYNGANNSGTVFNIRNADFRATNDALNQPAYQRVNTATDYDTVGFKPYLKFNGTNQWLQTNSIDFSYGDKMFVAAGVRKLSDASVGVVTELSVSAGGGTSGTFVLHGQTSPVGYRYAAGSGASGAAFATDDASVFTAPITNVVSGISDFAGVTIADEISVRVNGAAPTQTQAGTISTGNFGNYPLYIGARGGSSLWFNGRLHQLVVAGKQASDSEISQTEAFTNQKTGAY